jgi:predicted nucleic acid-binding protein
VTLLVDTSAWALALRRDALVAGPEVQKLKEALLGADIVITTGLVLQELLQGFSGPKAGAQIIERFAALPLLRGSRTRLAARWLQRRYACCFIWERPDIRNGIGS